MGTSYCQISLAERRHIQKLVDAKVPVASIAAVLGRHRSTIHREISRNFYHTAFRDRWGNDHRGYFCTTADRYAQLRRARCRKLIKYPDLRDHVIARIKERWSPEQISGRLKVQPLPSVGTISHETIYRFVYGPEGKALNLHACLASARRRRRIRSGRKPRSGPIPQANWIANRPEEVAARKVFGHWEGDLVIFARNQGSTNISSLLERCSRFQIQLSNDDRKSGKVITRISEALSALPAQARRSITFDRGSEFLAFKSLPMESYFCDPRSPWQKGAVENANGRLRRYLPLASAAADRSAAALAALANHLNSIPRRCLSYQTPAEVFSKNLAAIAINR